MPDKDSLPAPPPRLTPCGASPYRKNRAALDDRHQRPSQPRPPDSHLAAPPITENPGGLMPPPTTRLPGTPYSTPGTNSNMSASTCGPNSSSDVSVFPCKFVGSSTNADGPAASP